MKEKLKNKKVVYTIIGIVSVLLVMIAVTYAYWLVTKTQTNENEISSACLDITISGEKNDITLTNQFPMSDEDGMKLVPYEFTVTNNCNTSVDYQVALEATGDSSNALSATSLKVALNDSVKLYSAYPNVETTIDGAYESRVLGYSKLAVAGNDGSSATYELRIWIDEDAPISEMNKTFKSKISVTIGQGIENPYEQGTLAYDVLANYGGVNATSEIDTTRKHETIVTGNQYISTSSDYYYGTKYTYDEASKRYTLSGTLTQAKLEECRNGTKACGKYTLKNTSSTSTHGELYEITNFQSSGNYVTANTIVYINAFSKGTTAEEAGLYKTQDDLGDSYYFRGNPINNYVQFGKKETVETVYNLEGCYEEGAYCLGEYFDSYDECYKTYDYCKQVGDPEEKKTIDELYWRILRINGDGTIRLVYDGIEKEANTTKHNVSIGESVYNELVFLDEENYIYSYEIGYTYDDGNEKQVDSKIKEYVEAWYAEQLAANYGKYIADGIFCNDKSDSDLNNYSDVYDRMMLSIPSLKCQNKSDRYTVNDSINGNGLLNYPIGLISADEEMFAGGRFMGNSEYFLENEGGYWTMSPYAIIQISDRSPILTSTSNYGLFNDYGDNYPNNVRPVINLKAGVIFTGDGTFDNPYKIVTE